MKMNDKNNFPVLKKEYILRQYHIESDFKPAICGLYNGNRVELNDDGLFVLKHFTGQYSIKEILSIISKKYNISLNKAASSVQSIIIDLEQKNIITLETTKTATRQFPEPIKVRGLLDNIYIRLTNACNLNCHHCSVNSREKLKDELPPEKYFDIIDQIYQLMVPLVIFTGGEPTLVKFLPELIKYAYDKPMKVILMTNGYKITKQYAARLVKNGLSRVNISIDGSNENTHDEFRGLKGAFKRAIHAIEIFKDLGADIETTTVINENNYSEVEEILKFEQKYDLAIMKFLPIMPAERGKNCDYEKSLSLYVNDSLKKIGHIITKRESLKKDTTSPAINNKQFRCNAGEGVLTIKSNGDVLPCNNFHTISLGNIKDQSLYEIYNHSPRIKDVSNAIKISNSECESCSLLNYCKGGCAMVSLCYQGDYGKCDILRKHEILEVMRREGIIPATEGLL